MKIQVLYFDGCPNHLPTVERVRKVVADTGRDVVVEEIEVHDAAEAKRLRFLGSPTVQVDGRDIDPHAHRGGYSFSCRMYGTSGVPPREMIETALETKSDA